MIEKIAIKFLSWKLRIRKTDNIEIVIRSNGSTRYKRNFAKEESMRRTLSKIK